VCSSDLLSTRSNKEIAKLVHVGQDRVRSVRAAQADPTRIFLQMGRPTKVTPQIKQMVIQLTLQHLNFADLQITQIISEQFAIPIARGIIN
jgi:transposase